MCSSRAATRVHGRGNNSLQSGFGATRSSPYTPRQARERERRKGDWQMHPATTRTLPSRLARIFFSPSCIAYTRECTYSPLSDWPPSYSFFFISRGPLQLCLFSEPDLAAAIFCAVWKNGWPISAYILAGESKHLRARGERESYICMFALRSFIL